MRIHRLAGGVKEWFIIRRLSCTNEACPCKLHRELPDCLQEFKHYDTSLIEDVIDEAVTSDDLETEDYPCGDTMKLWRKWWSHNRDRAEGWMRSAAYRLFDFGYGFLKSEGSLLEQLRERLYRGWLKAALQFIYDTGGRLLPVRPPG